MVSDITDFASLAPAYPEMVIAVGAVILLLLGVVLNKERSTLVAMLAIVLLRGRGGLRDRCSRSMA